MKYFSLLLFLFSFAFASCSKTDDAPNAPKSGEQLVKFNIQAPAARAGSGITRYIVEAYEGNDLTATPTRTVATTAALTLALKKKTDYTFLFWADSGTTDANNGYWDATSLKEVKITAGKESTVGETAYCHKVAFNSADFAANKDVTLKNATAQINFVEMTGLTAAANTLTVKYASGGILNVATGAITEVTNEVIHTFSNIAKAAQGATLATDYILAPLGEKRLVELKLTFNTEAEKTIASVPLQQSHKTNVKGEYSNLYSSEFNISNEIEDYNENPDVEFPAKVKVGDFYYANNIFSSTYIANAQNPCIGIVFWIDPTDATKGKIVGLTEGTYLLSGVEDHSTLSYSRTDGRANMTTVASFIDNPANNTLWANYSVFLWAAKQNGKLEGGWDAAADKWYLPAIDELKALFGKYNGDTKEDNNVKAAVNLSLASIAGAAKLSTKFYWSNTENSNYNNYAVSFNNGSVDPTLKGSTLSARCIRVF